jgi:hypothetical protein
MESVLNSETLRQKNQTKILQDTNCQNLIDEMKVIEEFIGSFGFLQFGRDFIWCRK